MGAPLLSPDELRALERRTHPMGENDDPTDPVLYTDEEVADQTMLGLQIPNPSSTPFGQMMASLCGSDQPEPGPFQPSFTSMATGTASNTCGLPGTRCR